VMLIPTFRLMSLGIALVVVGAVFTLYSLWIRQQFISHPNSPNYSKSDWKWYVYFPIIGDVLVLITALWMLSGSTDALNILPVAVGVLLIVSVRNTWDLIIWIAQSRQKMKS